MVEYRYNEQGQLVEYINGANQTTSYGYDGTGMRIAKTESGKTVSYYWDRGYIANECRPGEDTEPLYTSNYLEVDGIFARQQGESVQYLMKNGHGDVTAIVEDGAVAYVHTHGAVLPNTPRSSDKFLSSDDLAKIEWSEVETRIQTAEEAVRLALYFAESNEGARVYDNATYYVFYLEEYDWWCVTFAGSPEINIYINPSSEWPYCVILSGDGELVYESPVYDIGNGKEKAKIWQQLEAEKREIQPLWEWA